MRLIFWRAVLGCFCLFAAVSSVWAESLAGRTIFICGDLAEWPPYIYFERVDGEKTGEIAGFSVDVIREILAQHGARLEVRLLPWKRCLYEVEKGDNYQIVLDASYSEARAKAYYYSRPYYEIIPYYFFSKKHYPNGLNIQKSVDLKHYRINGITGYNYADYGLGLDDIEAYVADHRSLIQKLHRNRCDLFPDWLEVVMGFVAIGKDTWQDEDLGYAPVPDLAPSQFYMLFTKNATGMALKKIVDEGLGEMEASGRLQELRNAHAERLSGQKSD